MKSTLAGSLGKLCLVGLGAFAATGCGGESGQSTGSSCPTSETLTYENFGKEFMATNCLACHGAAGPESPKFDTVQQIRSNVTAIDQQAAAGPNAVNTLMPESASVPEADRRKLGEWLACGAP